MTLTDINANKELFLLDCIVGGSKTLFRLFYPMQNGIRYIVFTKIVERREKDVDGVRYLVSGPPPAV